MEGLTLGQKLKAARRDRSVDDVVDAYKLRWGRHRGLSRGSLPRWEKDDSRPNEIVLARLAKIYDVPLSELDPDAEAAILEFSALERLTPGGMVSGDESKKRGSCTLRKHNGRRADRVPSARLVQPVTKAA